MEPTQLESPTLSPIFEATESLIPPNPASYREKGEHKDIEQKEASPNTYPRKESDKERVHMQT